MVNSNFREIAMRGFSFETGSMTASNGAMAYAHFDEWFVT